MDGHAILIQSDWNECIDKSSVWITCKRRGEKGEHGKISNGGASIDLPNFSCRLLSPGVLQVQYKDNDPVKIVAAERVFNKVHAGRAVTSLDVTPGGLGVSAGDDTVIHVWDSTSGTVRRELSGHKADVNSVRWFPSGQVVLSAGADMQVKVWSATDGSCPVTLVGHKQAVTDTAIVDKGRNVLSVAKDGDVRLWHCGEARCIAVVASVQDAANCCSIADGGEKDAKCEGEDGEVGTEGKMLAVGGEGGVLSLVDVAGRKVVSSVRLGAAVHCVDLTRDMVVAGLEDGRVVAHRPSDLDTPLWKTHDSNSAVLCVKAVGGGVAVGRKDGTVEVYIGRRRVVLTGPDTEAVYGLAVDKDSLYTSCRDGNVRKYPLTSIK